MPRLLADENVSGPLLHALRDFAPAWDIVRALDVGLGETADPMILSWCAREDRLLLTHDRATMPDYAYERVTRGLPLPGVIVVRGDMPIGRAIEEIVALVEVSLPGELEGQVRYIPL
jgi:hypothetical protein